MTFGNAVETLVGFTVERDTLTTAIATWQAADAQTRLNEAVYDAVNRARAAPTSLSGVLVLTDGRDEGSALTLDDAIQNAVTGSVPVYTVGVGPQVDAQALRRVARLTGGRFLAARSASEIAGLYRVIWGQMRDLYIITIPLRDFAPGKHAIHVTVRHQGHDLSEQRAFEWSGPGASTAERVPEGAPVAEAAPPPAAPPAMDWRLPGPVVVVGASVIVLVGAVALVWLLRRRRTGQVAPAEACAFVTVSPQPRVPCTARTALPGPWMMEPAPRPEEWRTGRHGWRFSTETTRARAPLCHAEGCESGVEARAVGCCSATGRCLGSMRGWPWRRTVRRLSRTRRARTGQA